MKILIVDDEELTRKGLIQTVDWEKLGITELCEAEDGESGLRAALEEKPDIVLCDVRMPRMDGIRMLEQIEEELPDVVAVFMSGYSDKEYLKAAIKLKAINYIEKPIESQELLSTLQNAVDQCNRLMLQSGFHVTHENQIASQLAYYFTMPYAPNRETVDMLSAGLTGQTGKSRIKYITTLLLKLRNVPDKPDMIPQIFDALRGYLSEMHMNVIYTEKKLYHIVFHVLGERMPGKGSVKMIAEQIARLVDGMGEYYLSVGDTEAGIASAYLSYESAVINLQNCFFYEPGTILTEDMIELAKDVDGAAVMQLAEAVELALVERDEDKIISLHRELYNLLNQSKGILPNQLKSVYYDMLHTITRERYEKQMVMDLSLSDSENIIDSMDQCFSFRQLSRLLEERTKQYFADIRDNSSENPTIRIIREYINNNFHNPMLSVKSISEYANLSVSYACTFFKSETGVTLNQYITDYRIKKAKQLLTDPRIRVAEVSNAVGYNDGNYFAKSFRKATGLSPSEYREQVIRS